jgi:hypothetical protein
MRIEKHAHGVIRHQATGLYFVEGRNWVASPELATKYHSLAEAADLCRRLELTDVELVTEAEFPAETAGCHPDGVLAT